jgi:hypothetical protein
MSRAMRDTGGDAADTDSLNSNRRSSLFADREDSIQRNFVVSLSSIGGDPWRSH